MLKPTTSFKTLRAEYEGQGFIRSSIELADRSICPLLIEDAKVFRTLELKNTESGLKQVPYLMTDNIVRVSHDRHIVDMVSNLLGGEPWVMWGANIREGTPNQADQWHVDLESWLWSTMTVVIGLEDCTPESATWCLPGSHQWLRAPNQTTHVDSGKGRGLFKKNDVPAAEQFLGFENGRFYMFNARSWHRGVKATSVHRKVLFLHYHRADDPRIPLMIDYEQHRWSKEPAPFLAEGDETMVNPQIAQFPFRYRIGQALHSLHSKLMW